MTDTFRMEYRELSDDDKAVIDSAKVFAEALLELYGSDQDQQDGGRRRCVALAKTRLEESIMWYTKAVTG